MAEKSAARTAAIATVIAAVIGSMGAVAAALLSGNGPKPKPVRVAAAYLTAPVTSFNVRCPSTFRFEGKIDVEGGTGDVVYRWLWSDGPAGQTSFGDRQRVAVDGPGSVPVTDE